MRQYLIAESGGTKTDWCFIDKCKTKTYFTRKSYHPLYCTEEFLESERQFWLAHAYMMEVEVIFYGSGCFRPEGNTQVSSFLSDLGFDDVTVLSDLHAAGNALYGEDQGAVVILGTGSVLFHWRNNDVENLVGGKGFLRGDEGSGFYFGKLIYDAYVKGGLNSEQQKVVNSIINWKEFDQSFSNQTHKKLFSELSFKLKDFRLLFEEFHVKNLEAFCKTHFENQSPQNVSVVGGYGYHQKDLVKKIFTQFGVSLNEFLARPIERIVERTVLLSD